ncbi:MAG: hypothetical protein IJD35_04655 [Clostridia bacterium]|nr:hypothetical protein [Clostridia bacterium]
MKNFLRLVRRNRPFWCAVLAFLYGMSLLAALGKHLPQPDTLPIRSALATPQPALSFVADYAKEAELFLPMVCLSLAVSHPLFVYGFLFVRGLFCGFSAAALFWWGIPLSFCCIYLVLHISVLVAYTAMVYCLLPAINNRKPLTFAFPFFFYAGIIFLLCIIRNLVYYLLLK